MRFVVCTYGEIMKSENGISKPKHLAVRIALFAAFFLLAVGAFAYGVVGYGHQEEGYQSISTSADEEEPNYASGFTLQYYFEGRSDAIKQQMKQVSEVYSTALKRAYKLLDKNNAYDGYNNLYTLNIEPGHPVVVSAELYAVLQDAYDKTCQNQAYSLFSGAVNDHWNSILYSDDPQNFDPAVNEEERERLETLTAATMNRENFTLIFGEGNTITFTVSDAYQKVLASCEFEGNVLDVGMLHDAYVVSIVANALEDAGFTEGYLTTESGITHALSGQKSGKMAVYDANGEVAKQVSYTPGSAFCQFRLYPLIEGELGYYSVDGHFRSPAASPLKLNETKHSAAALSKNGSAPDAAFACLKLLSGGELSDESLPALVITKEGSLVENDKMIELQ